MASKNGTVKGQPDEVAAWDRAVVVSPYATRNEWLVAVWNVGARRGAPFDVPAYTGEPAPARTESVSVSFVASTDDWAAWEKAAARARLNRHAWQVLLANTAAGLSDLPEQLTRLRSESRSE